ncbi:MAG TPA: response regulator [Thermoanaerobaculia bacterium]|jgi:CheY-like chemotaxis protein|nr:response regulator [Thermoanaerobaculia bacterium]
MPHERILVIDDEEDIREVTSLTLEEAGFEVLTASSGREGIERAIAEQPDAILLDVMMPEMDGPATLLKLQQTETTRAIPVLFLTAKIQPADKRTLSSLGAVAILSKPFDPDRLGGDINHALGWTTRHPEGVFPS